MLTKETLLQQETLKGLTDEQVDAITSLSKNDETVVLNKKIGELHGRYDKDIEELTGIKNENNLKSYVHMKNILKDYKEKAGKVDDIKTKLEAAEQKLLNTDEGDDQKVTDLKAQVKKLQNQLETQKESFDKAQEQFDVKLKDTQFEHQAGLVRNTLVFKDVYDKEVADVLVDNALNAVRSKYKYDFIDDEASGKKVLVFRDENNEIVRNSENAQNPFTLKDLLTKDKSISKALAEERKVEGGGTHNRQEPNGKPKTIQVSEVKSAKTQVEADEIIASHLLQKGFVRGSADFGSKQTEIRKEYNVKELPVR